MNATLRVMPMPCNANTHGNVFGGWILSQVDIAAMLRAQEETNGPVVTVKIEDFTFHHPAIVGEVLSFICAVEKVGRTSITLSVSVRTAAHDLIASGTLKFVAVDKSGRPRPVKETDHAESIRLSCRDPQTVD